MGKEIQLLFGFGILDQTNDVEVVMIVALYFSGVILFLVAVDTILSYRDEILFLDFVRLPIDIVISFLYCVACLPMAMAKSLDGTYRKRVAGRKISNALSRAKKRAA